MMSLKSGRFASMEVVARINYFRSTNMLNEKSLFERRIFTKHILILKKWKMTKESVQFCNNSHFQKNSHFSSCRKFYNFKAHNMLLGNDVEFPLRIDSPTAMIQPKLRMRKKKKRGKNKTFNTENYFLAFQPLFLWHLLRWIDHEF